MSAIKKHLTSDAKHVLPTYKKLPPIQSPPPFTGLTVTKIDKTRPGDDSIADATVTQISSSDQKLVFNRTAIMGKGEDSLNTESEVKLIGYKSLDDQKKGYIPPGKRKYCQFLEAHLSLNQIRGDDNTLNHVVLFQTLCCGYSKESSQQEESNEYPHHKVS